MTADDRRQRDYCGKGLEGWFERFGPLVRAGPIWDRLQGGLRSSRIGYDGVEQQRTT
jgi:hypothetical protein